MKKYPFSDQGEPTTGHIVVTSVFLALLISLSLSFPRSTKAMDSCQVQTGENLCVFNAGTGYSCDYDPNATNRCWLQDPIYSCGECDLGGVSWPLGCSISQGGWSCEITIGHSTCSCCVDCTPPPSTPPPPPQPTDPPTPAPTDPPQPPNCIVTDCGGNGCLPGEKWSNGQCDPPYNLGEGCYERDGCQSGTPAPTPTPANDPQGYFDPADPSCNFINGWTGDKDSVNTTTDIELKDENGSIFYSQAASVKSEAAVCRDIVDDSSNDDFCDICDDPNITPTLQNHPYCFHRFRVSIPENLKNGALHSITGTGINIPSSSGSNKDLTNSPLAIQCTPPVPKAWFQVVGGDIVSGGDISSDVDDPGTNYLITTINPLIPTYFPGIAISGSSPYSVTPIAPGISQTNWSANSSFKFNPATFSFANFKSMIPTTVTPETINIVGNNRLKNCNAPARAGGYCWLNAPGDLVVSLYQDIGNSKTVLFVSGDLKISSGGRINVDDGSGFFMAIVSGDIIVESSFPASSGANQILEGVYFADRDFVTQGDNAYPVKVRGSVASMGGFTLQRTLSGGNTSPSEIFEYGPDLLFNYPKYLTNGEISWKEVAP